MDTSEPKIEPKKTSVNQRPVNVPKDVKLHKMLRKCGMAIILALSFLAFATLNLTFFNKFGIVFNGGPTFFLLAIIYFAISLKEVQINEVAGTFCYGKALDHIEPGLHFVPFGLMQISPASRIVQEFQCPGEPEKVFKGDDKDPLPEGKDMVRPIRAVTRAPKKEEKGILDTQMTLIVNFVVQYAITDIFDYVSNFGSTKEIEKQLRDVGEVKIIEEITQNTPASFIENLQFINKNLGNEIGKRFKNSGVKIISVRLISPDITHDVSGALAKTPIERATAQQTVIKAEAEKIKRIKERQGDAAGELAWLTAQAEGRKKILDALKVDGNAVLASEAVRSILDKTDVLVMGEGGMKDAMGLVKAAQSALNTGKGEQK